MKVIEKQFSINREAPRKQIPTKKIRLFCLLVAQVVAAGCASPQLPPGARWDAEVVKSLTQIAEQRTDGGKSWPIKLTRYLSNVIGTNQPALRLHVDYTTDVKFPVPLVQMFGKADTQNRGESECLRVMENFRKAGLPPEFERLVVSVELPPNLRHPNLSLKISDTTLCAFVISREDLQKGTPPQQTVKDYHLLLAKPNN